MKYVTFEETKEAFAEHLKKYRNYSDSEVAFVLSDLKDFYDFELCEQDYLGYEEIEGLKYEKRAAWVAFQEFGGGKAFRFYMYFYYDSNFGRTVAEYMNCKRLYRIDDIEDSDFPDWVNEQD